MNVSNEEHRSKTNWVSWTRDTQLVVDLSSLFETFIKKECLEKNIYIIGCLLSRNPITAARNVKENSSHVLLISDGARRFALEHGVQVRQELLLRFVAMSQCRSIASHCRSMASNCRNATMC